MAALYLGESLLDHLLGQARALAALGAYFQGIAYFAIAAAAFVDGFANLTVSDT
ncbi:hypothetical protein D9M69_575310 [compost metagenome]